ncbi:MAG TPA: hypothetical protein VFA21_19015 [Pyrinomonadaceae bacterium]|nr:hypothetical protein [Pyrinomonadaceae bacterium]
MTKKTPFLLSLSLAAGIGLLACGGAGSDNTSNASNAAGNTNKAATTNTAASNTSTTASGDKIGVAECDDFLAKYEACVNGKVPAAAQATFKTGMEQWRKSWKELAANPQTKATLQQVCKTQLDSAKTSLSSYGCAW